MVEKLLDKVFKYVAVRVALEHAKEKDAILGVGWQDMVSLPAVKASDLHRCYTKRRPSRSPEANSFITSRFIHIDKLIRSKG